MLESIRTQTYQDFEVIVVNSGDELISDLIREYGFKEVREKVNLLNARYLAHKNSSGEKALVLDETRVLRKDTLEILSEIEHDMIIVGEAEVGNSSLWIRLAQLDKDNLINCNEPDAVKGFLLPRAFNSELLTKTFELLRDKLGDKFDKVLYPDHELIYFTSRMFSNKLHVIRDSLIFHYGDETFLSIIRKYYRYGRSLRILKGTEFQILTKTSRKKRKICKGSKLGLYTLYVVRGIPFILGYLLG